MCLMRAAGGLIGHTRDPRPSRPPDPGIAKAFGARDSRSRGNGMSRIPGMPGQSEAPPTAYPSWWASRLPKHFMGANGIAVNSYPAFRMATALAHRARPHGDGGLLASPGAPPPVPQLVPPYAVPAVAKTVLTIADLPDSGGAGWLAIQSPLAPRRLAVPIRARASMLIDSVSFGGKLVMATGRKYGPNDPNCCPSVPVHRTFAWTGTQLRWDH